MQMRRVTIVVEPLALLMYANAEKVDQIEEVNRGMLSQTDRVGPALLVLNWERIEKFQLRY